MPNTKSPRIPLNRERVVTAAVAVADRDGLAGLTMRSLATELGLKPMSVYHYFDGKEQILDAIVDRVFSEIEVPLDLADWREAIRRHAHSARQTLNRHPWALPVLESRANPGPETLRRHDAVLGVFRRGGFTVAQTAHAIAVVDAYVYGFALQEASLPFESADQIADMAASMTAAFPVDAYPYLAELAVEHVMLPGYSYASEFDFGLELIIDGLAALVG